MSVLQPAPRSSCAAGRAAGRALCALHCHAGLSTLRALRKQSMQMNAQTSAKKGNVHFTAPSWHLHQLSSLCSLFPSGSQWILGQAYAWGRFHLPAQEAPYPYLWPWLYQHFSTSPFAHRRWFCSIYLLLNLNYHIFKWNQVFAIQLWTELYQM